MTENAIAKEIVDAAFRIHTTLGPGLLESVYDMVLAYELDRRGLQTVRQQAIPLVHEDVRIDTGFRAGLIVEDKVIVECCRHRRGIETAASVLAPAANPPSPKAHTRFNTHSCRVRRKRQRLRSKAPIESAPDRIFRLCLKSVRRSTSD